MEAIALIVCWLTREATVAEVCAIDRDHGCRHQASIHLIVLNYLIWAIQSTMITNKDILSEKAPAILMSQQK